jgi:hypothetical protein
MPVGEVYAASRQSSGAQYPLPMPYDRGEQLRTLRELPAARQTRCEPTLLKVAKPNIGIHVPQVGKGTAGQKRAAAEAPRRVWRGSRPLHRRPRRRLGKWAWLMKVTLNHW